MTGYRGIVLIAVLFITSALSAPLSFAETFTKNQKTFLWGAGFSSHQVEGGDFNTDWWQWEQQPGKIEKGENTRVCTDHYNRYAEDFEFAQYMGLDVVRLSVSWGRIEPKPGVFDQKELNHYKAVIQDLKSRGIEPIVTLHHFTHPTWFHPMGGWTHRDSPKIFARFAEKVAQALSPDVRIWITFNEPHLQAISGFLKGEYPPGISDFSTAVKVFENLVRAHGLASKVIQKKMKKMSRSDLPIQGVGLALNVHAFNPVRPIDTINGQEDLKAIQTLSHVYQWVFLTATQTGKIEWTIPSIPALPKGSRVAIDVPEAKSSLQWVGINYYTAWNIMRDPTNDLGIQWVTPRGGNVQPQGLTQVLREAKARLKDPIPLVVSENGLPDHTDSSRVSFIQAHLDALAKARQEGIDIRGYWHWSLTDNFEWNSGYAPRFGFVDIDYATLKRSLRPSGDWFKNLIKTHPNGPSVYLNK